MPFARANKNPAAPSTVHPASSAARKPPSDCVIGLILAFTLFPAAASAADPPPDLARLVAHRETETEAERSQFLYRQVVTVEELSDRGAVAGDYKEVREIVFSPEHERTEQLTGHPEERLKNLKLTEEDFRDIRDIQPLVLNEEKLFLYETKFRGEERMDDVDCWVLQVRPRQLLQGMRLFDGILWVDRAGYNIVRMEGQAVPQIRTTKQENLFPRFTTIRKPVDGKHWFAVFTYADDVLQFRTGPQRIRLRIRYSEYRRFGAESTVKFEQP
jgi:hypothetical protein